MTKRHLTLISIVVLAVFSRFLPHPWNWTAVGAATLFAGARFEKTWEALLVPVLALAISDLVLGWHNTMAFTYGAFLLIALAAHAGRDHLKGWKIAIAALGSSGFFFLVTNFGVWLAGGFYTPDFAGLMAAYVAGLPFLASQALGDLFYCGLLFGAWSVLEQRVPSLQPCKISNSSDNF